MTKVIIDGKAMTPEELREYCIKEGKSVDQVFLRETLLRELGVDIETRKKRTTKIRKRTK